MNLFSSKAPPLEFSFDIKPEKPCDVSDVVLCGTSFDLTLTIKSTASSTFSHRGVDFEFCTEYSPSGAKVIKYNETTTRLCEAGTINGSVDLQIPRLHIDEHTQTYHGGSFSVRHMLRVWVRKLLGSEFYEQEVFSYNVAPYANKIDPFCVRVSMQNVISVNFYINRRKFDLNDMIVGAAHFQQVDLKIKYLRAQLIAQEMTEVNGVPKKFKHIIDYWQLMYGTPVNTEMIPFRIFLKPVDVYPSCTNPQKGYSVTHFLHFTIITETGDKYCKNIQILLCKMNREPFFFIGEDDELIKKVQEESEPANNTNNLED